MTITSTKKLNVSKGLTSEMEFQQNNILTWHKMNWNTRHSSLNSFLIGSQFISKTLKKGIQKICFFFSLFFLSWRFLKQIMCRTYFRKQNAIVKQNFIAKSLREKCPNTEFFLVRIFLYLDWIQKNVDQKKLRIWTLFTQWIVHGTLSTLLNLGG